MKLAECVLESNGPYSQSKVITDEKPSRELHKDFEARIWRERCHATPDGNIFIPPMQFANSIKDAAKYLSIKIPGKRNSTFTKYFDAGIIVTEGLVLDERKDEVEGEWVYVPSDGVAGSGKRVLKCFPLIHRWKGTVTYNILDDIITEEAFRETLDYTGNIIGIGRFRPSRKGYYGRFVVKSVNWVE